MISPLDIQRLAVRIERMQQVHTHDWRGGEDLEFKNLLPGGRDRRALPDPKALRKLADEGGSPSMSDWQLWVTMAGRMENLVHANDPHNHRNLMRDMARGRFPGMR
jgi:hypothetical protein